MPQIVKRTQSSLFIYSDVDIVATIFIRKPNSYELIHTHNYLGNTIYFYTLPKDGVYKVIIDLNDVETEFIFPFFPSLINNLATEFKVFACSNCGDYLKDCGCSNLTTTAKKALKYNNLASKLLYLESGILFGYTDEEIANYRNYVYHSLKTLSCKSDKLLQKILDEECLKGISENTELYELLIIIKFIGIYLLEYNSTMNFVYDDIVPLLESEGVDLAEQKAFINLYKYSDWSECLCDTCLRLEEVTSIFDDGVVEQPNDPINYPPSCQSIFTQIYSTTTYYELMLTQAMFSAVYNDDTTAFPVSIQITSLPASPFVLEDINSVAVTVGQIIPFSDIGNYRLIAEFGDTPPQTHFQFEYRFSDGELSSPVCAVRVIPVQIVNQPPNVIESFSTQTSTNSVLIRKSELFNLGSVVDPEGDLIDKAKLVGIFNVDVELYDGSQYQPLLTNDEIDLTAFTNNGAFIRVILGSGNDFYFTLAFADVGSLTYSNQNIPNNVMTIKVILSHSIGLSFTGGWATFAKTVKNWIPVSRIVYNGDYRDLVISDIIQSGDNESIDLPYFIIPAESDTPYNTYRNAGAVVKPNSTNPPLNSFDVYFYTDILSSKDISFRVSTIAEDENVNSLNVTANLVVDVINNENPLVLMFTQFDETNIADFDYLENSETFPPNFVGTLDNPAVEVEWMDVIDGRHYNVPGVGLIGFILETPTLRNPRILDATNTDVTDTLFKKFFSATYGLEIYISKDVYAPSTLFFKFLF